MKSILKDKAYWPGMTSQVDEWVRSCRSCVLTSRKNKPEPMARSFLPGAPWENLAIDFNGPYMRLGGISVLVLVDAYSRFLITRIVRSTDFLSVKSALEDVFETFGFPKSIKSDRGPPFFGDEYKSFCSVRGITAQQSAPLNPQQNGQVERYMQIINKAVQIAMESGENFKRALNLAVKAHNGAVHSVTNAVPEELMLGENCEGVYRKSLSHAYWWMMMESGNTIGKSK